MLYQLIPLLIMVGVFSGYTLWQAIDYYKAGKPPAKDHFGL